MEINSTYRRSKSDKINHLNEMLFKWEKVLNHLELPFFINQSCALGLFREGHFFESERVIELGVLDEDLTEEKFAALITEKKLANCHIDFHRENEHVSHRGLLYFHDLELQPVQFKNHKAYYNLAGPTCIWFPEVYLLRENWGKIKYLDQDWNVPGNLPAFFQQTYGDWKVPRSFAWTTDAQNRCAYGDL